MADRRLHPSNRSTRSLSRFHVFGILLPLAMIFCAPMSVRADDSPGQPSDPLLDAMQAELFRAKDGLHLEGQPAPYFISFWIQEQATISLQGKNGGITHAHPPFHPHRYGGVEVRVGSPEFDNTDVSPTEEYSSEDFQDSTWSMWEKAALPVVGTDREIRATLWLLADHSYKQAVSDYQKKKGKAALAVKDSLPDFTHEKPSVFLAGSPAISFDSQIWLDRIRTTTRTLSQHSHVIDATMEVSVNHVVNYLVNTEGTRLRTEGTYFRVDLEGKAMSKDGVLLDSFRRYAVRDPQELPDASVLAADTVELASELLDLTRAEELVSYTGPAILDGDVAGVFLHEALGHRLEGERQRKPEEGHTFKDKIGKKVLPEFLTVVDDPTRDRYDGKTLNGTYSHDTEGIPARAVTLVEKGVLKNFLLSRTPIEGFEHSNGHGRAESPVEWDAFQDPVARMGNLILLSAVKTPFKKLKEKLLAEVKKKGRPFGLIIRRARSGETSTAAGGNWFGSTFQAWKTRPVLIYKVDVNSGKETLTRGAELIGTPLTSLEHIIDTGDKAQIFNGYCGAESGDVPVSIVSPMVLTTLVEIQRIGGTPKTTPILPSPLHEE